MQFGGKVDKNKEYIKRAGIRGRIYIFIKELYRFIVSSIMIIGLWFIG